ncbi:MAG TPA: hypothetical protein VIL74_05110 [Pyrinomonadaceae bacterium]|jgi:hypothetical protein
MPAIHKISRAAIGLSILFSLVFPFAAQTVGKRVQFPKGKNSVVYKGKLPRSYADYDYYTLRARKGQTLTVKLITDDPDASITIYETQKLGPDEDGVTPDEPKPLREWSGRLPITSEYSIQIYGPDGVDKKGTGKPYALEITIK